MSPSPPLRKSGKDAPFEAGVLTYGLHTDLLSAPSHPVGQWLFRREFRCRSQLRGQWRFLHRSSRSPRTHRVYQRGDAKSALCSCNLSPVKHLDFNRLDCFMRRELTEWAETVNWTAK